MLYFISLLIILAITGEIQEEIQEECDDFTIESGNDDDDIDVIDSI